MNRHGWVRIVLYTTALLLYTFKCPADQELTQRLFERVFGDAVKFDPAMVAEVLQGKPGERHYVDRDGNGKPEEVWFIDTALRHPKECQPLLVRVIDEDGDLQMGAEPDLDSDLYVADWKADGTIDAVCDYTDRDGDQDVDEMGMYFPGAAGGAAKDTLMVWWGDDVGDDNLLWYDIGYTYRQHACQYRSHFGGAELFCAFTIGLDDAEWMPLWENPFLFYDHDDDGVTEEVIRIGGRGDIIDNLRYSFDADHDATPDSPRDFDVSISAYAPTHTLLDAKLAERRTLRGIPTGAFLAYAVAPNYAREQRWTKFSLCWDENDLNIDGDGLREGRFTDTQERWEGVICKGNEFFPQIGGPSCGLFNKRIEVATTPTSTLRVYYAPTDQRLHLYGADTMWVAVDYDYDNQPDMRYEYADTDGNGYIDTWRLDTNGDGQPEDTWTSQDAAPTDVNYTWPEVSAVMIPLMASVPWQLLQLDARLQQAINKLGAKDADAVMQLVASGFDTPNLTEDLRVRLISSAESLRYYLDLVKDRLIIALKACHAQPDFWKTFDSLRARGDLDGLRGLVETAFSLKDPLPEFGAFQSALRAKYAKPRVAWGQDWVPPNIGWESEVCGYRAYWGQFDFFGKKKPCLVMPAFAPGGASYHEEQDWGMDVFHVGTTPGLGGVTLYVNDKPYPVWSPEGKGDLVWSKRLVSENPEAVTVELTAEKVGGGLFPAYTVRFRCTALAERRDSPIEVTVEGGLPEDTLALGIGITKLTQETFTQDSDLGILASWGVQDPVIGTIGLGVVYPVASFLRFVDLADQHQVVIKLAKATPVRYHIQGDWLNGRRFCRCPTMANWMADLKSTARTAALR